MTVEQPVALEEHKYFFFCSKPVCNFERNKAIPGLVALKRIIVNPQSGMATVSFIGALIKFLLISPLSSKTRTCSTVTLLPIRSIATTRKDEPWRWNG